MSKTWKWILGIVAALVIVGAAFAMGAAHRMRTVAFIPERGTFERNWNSPMTGQAPDEWAHPRVMPRNDGWEHPMIYDRGYAPYHSGFYVFSGLLKLALFFGMLYGAYWLGRRNARIVMDPKPVAPVADVSSPEAGSPVPTSEAETPPGPRKRARKVE
jgi:hypothetical protein